MGAITVLVKAQNVDVKTAREVACNRVQDHFERHFPLPADCRVLAFFDDHDEPSLKSDPANRGMHYRVDRELCVPWYIREHLYSSEDDSGRLKRVFSSLIYVHESTCRSDIGLTLTFAHELQHFLQYANARHLWATNVLLMNLPKRFPWQTEFKNFWDFPIEVEARIIAKRVGESLYDAEYVEQLVKSRITEPVTANDADDCKFFLSLNSAQPYDLLAATRPLVQTYKPLLQELHKDRYFCEDPDFSTLDFDEPYWRE